MRQAWQSTSDLIEKFCSIRVSRRGLAAGAAATLAARQGWEARAQDSPPVVYDGETFDAGGATLRVASWGGFWQEIERTYLLDQFQKDFNCTVQYDQRLALVPQVRRRRRGQPTVRRHDLEPARAVSGPRKRARPRVASSCPSQKSGRTCPTASTCGTSPTSPGTASPISSVSLVTATVPTQVTHRRASRHSGRTATRTSAGRTSPRTPCR